MVTLLDIVVEPCLVEPYQSCHKGHDHKARYLHADFIEKVAHTMTSHRGCCQFRNCKFRRGPREDEASPAQMLPVGVALADSHECP